MGNYYINIFICHIMYICRTCAVAVNTGCFWLWSAYVRAACHTRQTAN